MRKVYTFFTIILLALISGKVSAQNIQLYYDFGSSMYEEFDGSRSKITSTVEMLKPDKFGSTFFFVDFSYGPGTGIGNVYTEAFRDICLWKGTKLENLALHLEYNGGLSQNYAMGNNWLIGATYSLHSMDFSKVFSLTASYQYNPENMGIDRREDVHGYHLTGVWDVTFAQGWCQFTGFAEIWRQPSVFYGTTHKFLAKPQLWVNLNKLEGWEDIHLSVGTRFDIANNLYGKGFFAIPQTGVKWTF